MSNPSSAVALYDARRVAKTPSRPLDSLTNDNWFHISRAVVAPLMCIISVSLIASSIRVHTFVSPSHHFFCASISAAVSFNMSAGSGNFASAAIYFSSPRSHSTASIHRFHGIQFKAFSISIQ